MINSSRRVYLRLFLKWYIYLRLFPGLKQSFPRNASEGLIFRKQHANRSTVFDFLFAALDTRKLLLKCLPSKMLLSLYIVHKYVTKLIKNNDQGGKYYRKWLEMKDICLSQLIRIPLYTNKVVLTYHS